MNNKTMFEIKLFLAAVANNYMQGFQGDIIYDYDTIMERLKNNGEIEVYVGKMHFDTEKRFEWHDGATVAEARKNAREHHWGEYNIMLRIVDDKLMIEIERGSSPYKNFPVEQVNYIIQDRITLK